ncbi:MAG: SMI1/KNR4 family protein [Cyanobacteria bacterium TGS_CYA1]|nr:SMI1/KNR4 family protein [Cyanobacteria bacterium TGS_CYA1]
MSLYQLLKDIENYPFVDKSGKKGNVKLLPPVPDKEINEFRNSLPCYLDEDMTAVLRKTRGLSFVQQGKNSKMDAGPISSDIDFTGKSINGQVLEDIMPTGIGIASDKSGNSWVVDLHGGSAFFGPIFYVSHDPPVFIYQNSSLEQFINQVLSALNSPWKSDITKVVDESSDLIWGQNPGVMDQPDCLYSTDQDIKAFAQELEEDYRIIDMRRPKVGDGFSWGISGPETMLRRYGYQTMFAYQYIARDNRPWWQKLFGRK